MTILPQTSILSLPSGRTISYTFPPYPATGPVVLLSTSICVPLNTWDDLIQVLTTSGFRVLRYSHPGHGHSSTPQDLASTTLESLAGDVHSLLRHVNVPTLHAWIGVSLGAAAGVVFVTRYPDVVRRLIVCDTISASPASLGLPDVFGPRVEAARKAGSLEQTVRQTLDRWLAAEWRAAHPGETERMRELMMTTSLDGYETCVHAIRDREFDLRPLLQRVGAGCDAALLVVGERDANLPETMEEMRHGIEKWSPGVQLRVIKDAGHLPYVDGFDEFCDVVVDFLH